MCVSLFFVFGLIHVLVHILFLLSPLMQASGYRYEVIGGQHNLLASKRMHEKHPENKIFSARNCQVYFGKEMTFECKAWLGVMNNKVGETRRQSTTKEKVKIKCMNLAMVNPSDCN